MIEQKAIGKKKINMVMGWRKVIRVQGLDVSVSSKKRCFAYDLTHSKHIVNDNEKKNGLECIHSFNKICQTYDVPSPRLDFESGKIKEEAAAALLAQP